VRRDAARNLSVVAALGNGMADRSAIIDTVGDYALVMLLVRPVPTVNFCIDYLRPAINTALTITGRVRRSGRLVGVVDIDVVNEAGQLVAIGRATYATAAE
jgi:uncharacterized protein (TIGR00369 family)